MHYHVGRDGHQFGQFTEEEIRQGLESGRFLTSDLVWRDGMPQWKPLVEVFGFAAAAALKAPMISHGGPLTVPPGTSYPQYPGTMPYQHVGIPVMPMSGLAIASLVMGILSIVSFLGCPLSVVLGVPGVICGHMSLAEIERSGNQMQGRGMAVAGLVMNYIAVAIAVCGLLFILLFVGIGAFGAATGAGGGGSVP